MDLNMNKYLENHLSDLAHKNLNYVFILIYALIFVGIISLYNRSYVLPLLFAYVVIMPWFHSKLVIDFRKKQINWLKNNGTKISRQLKKFKTGVITSYGYSPKYVLVEGRHNGKERVFKSDIISWQVNTWQRGKKEKIIETIGKDNIEVLISKNNSDVYWVNTNQVTKWFS
ncbi:hypothetical protein COS53_04070 [Candidatus Shapirobacteria bacterium CG03_land_8_20_14_0_80_35_14]|uniref:Uncharacterized protein n=1 Tax=Candidatus Shapirobacteria bacterium CG03_land_8_20_14_0_80_35_14 TaxID=1974878 RepID=A0A2M7BM77_9BACT|nr:MAG: hypothetical protein COS53_04070 [Candidatus Shapirobacteria bacterium CG03_land_8_20_14_0_80_35_14]